MNDDLRIRLATLGGRQIDAPVGEESWQTAAPSALYHPTIHPEPPHNTRSPAIRPQLSKDMHAKARVQPRFIRGQDEPPRRAQLGAYTKSSYAE